MEQPKRQPLYVQIAGTLRAELLRQPAGTPVAAERALMDRFSVSRGTVRQAIAQLVKDGLVERIQGSGTFRAKQPEDEQTFRLHPSSVQRVKEIGRLCEYHDLAVTTVRATNEIADLLRLERGSKVRRIYRVPMMHGSPIAISVAYARIDLLPHLSARTAKDVLIGFAQEEGGRYLCERRCMCTAVVASESDAAVLGLAPGTPMLQFRFTASVVGAGPFIVDTFRIVPGYSFSIEPGDAANDGV